MKTGSFVLQAGWGKCPRRCVCPLLTLGRVLVGEGAEAACEGREMIDLLVLFCGFRPTGHQP